MKEMFAKNFRERRYRWNLIFVNKKEYFKGKLEILSCMTLGDILDFINEKEIESKDFT